MVHKFDNIHTCPLPERGFRQRNATSKMIAALCIQQLRDYKRVYTPGDIKADILSKMGVDISYNKAWQAKELALKILLGGPAEGYLRLPIYLHVLGEAYPGSCLRYKKSEQNQFMYLFIALNVSIRGFDHCRPIVVVDGSHLNGDLLGTFVSASTLDGAGNIPLAYGVVDSENDASWTWFFEQFRDAYGVREDMAIVSDSNKSIWKSVRIVFPERSADTLVGIYYRMAKSYRREEFNELMAELKGIDPRVKEYLCEVGYDKWARSYARVNRGRMTTSNFAECINGCLVEARKLPFMDFLEKARELFVKWNVVDGEKARYMSPEVLGSRFQEIYTLNDMRSIRLRATKSSEHVYTVDSEGIRYVVSSESHMHMQPIPI